jgi:uroporphyrinogen-III synthase
VSGQAGGDHAAPQSTRAAPANLPDPTPADAMATGSGSRIALPVVLTRPAGQNAALATRLRAVGREVLDLPSLQLTPLSGPAPDPAAFELVVFVSGNAVRFYLDARRDAAGGWTAWPDKVAAATVGPSSSAALRSHPAFGSAPLVIQPSPNAATFDSESLWTELAALDPMPRSVLIVRGGSGPEGRGRDWLAARLRDAGVTVTIYSAYRREPAPWSHEAILVTSKEGADALRSALQDAGLLDWYAGCRLVATHPRIASHVGDAHFRTVPASLTPAAREPLLQISSPRDDDIFAAIESTP